MAVRPFYIEATIDGRATTLEGGPRRKDGGTEIVLYQRDKGKITTPYKVVQRNYENGDGDHILETEVYYQGELIHSHFTDY